MKTIQDYKELLFDGEENTLLGLHLNSIFKAKDLDYNATILNFEEKVEVMAQMSKNGIDVFKDSFKLGSVTKAYYQVQLAKYQEYK